MSDHDLLHKTVDDLHRRFYEHIDGAIAYNLRHGYRGDLFAWVEIADDRATFHVSRRAPTDAGCRFTTHVLKYDLSDDSKALEFLDRYSAKERG